MAQSRYQCVQEAVVYLHRSKRSDEAVLEKKGERKLPMVGKRQINIHEARTENLLLKTLGGEKKAMWP